MTWRELRVRVSVPDNYEPTGDDRRERTLAFAEALSTFLGTDQMSMDTVYLSSADLGERG